MIVTVKIASKERWCVACLNDALEHGVDVDKLAGLSVDIYTESMQQHWANYPPFFCDGRIWKLTVESTNKCNRLTGLLEDDHESWLCEHILEMD